MKLLRRLLIVGASVFLGFEILSAVLRWNDSEFEHLGYKHLSSDGPTANSEHAEYVNWADTVRETHSDTSMVMEYCTEVDSVQHALGRLVWSIMTAGTEPFAYSNSFEFGYPVSIYRIGHRSKKAATVALDDRVLGSLLSSSLTAYTDSCCKAVELRAIDGVSVVRLEFPKSHIVAVTVSREGKRACIQIEARMSPCKG